MTDVSRPDAQPGAGATAAADAAFSNFSMLPPKTMLRLRQFTRRSKYRVMAEMRGTRDPMRADLGSLSGSRSRLDASRLMSLQDDARSRRISAEVMKKRLYESVVTVSSSPHHRHRRFSMQHDYSTAAGGSLNGWDGGMLAFAIQSLPTTPAQSQPQSPTGSPDRRTRFAYGLYSRGATPRGTTPTDEEMREVEEEEEEGLASLFSPPRPRCIPAVRPRRVVPAAGVRDVLTAGIGDVTDVGPHDVSTMGLDVEGPRDGNLVLAAPPSLAERHADSPPDQLDDL